MLQHFAQTDTSNAIIVESVRCNPRYVCSVLQKYRGRNHMKTIELVFALLGGYGVIAAFPMMLVGVFVGPRLLVAGALHAAVGCTALMIRRGLKRRSRIARWAALGLASAVAAAFSAQLIAIVADRSQGVGDRIGGALVPIAGVIVMCATFVALLRADIRILGLNSPVKRPGSHE